MANFACLTNPWPGTLGIELGLIDLPRATGARAADRVLAMPSGLADRNVLIVEDDVAIAIDLADLSMTQGANVVGPAWSVADALTYIRSSVIDCAILDVNLGGEDSSSVADLLSQAEIPFIFVTAYNGHDILSRYPSQPVVTKPYDPSSVIVALIAALASGAP